MPRWILLATAFFLTTSLALCAEDKPVAAETTDAETAEKPPADPEESALRDALKVLAKALQEGDGPGIRKAMHAGNDIESKMLDAMANMAVQIAELRRASTKIFGDEEAKVLTGEVALEMGRIDEAELIIEGESATVRYAPPATVAASTGGEADPPPPPPPMVLKKVDGRWRVPIAELSKDTTPDEIDQRLNDLDTQTKIITELSTEITQGKYKNAEKAAEAWQGKMMQALNPRKPATETSKEPEQKEK